MWLAQRNTPQYNAARLGTGGADHGENPPKEDGMALVLVSFCTLTSILTISRPLAAGADPSRLLPGPFVQ
jgi:hypothetical protein